MFRNILVPTDGSAMSRRAVKRAMQLAKEQKARVTSLWVGPVWQPTLYAYDESVPARFISPRQFEASIRKIAARQLGAVRKAAAAAGVPCRTLFTQSSFPQMEIIKAARRNRCDLIVMASHGRRGISRLLLGSQTGMVLAHAAIPVMVCR
jgi:nucleotide-binding universal stress UspA family protein